MADVKWIKIVTDIFDDEKILLIEAMPEADSIIVIWFKLLALAGKTNNKGVFLISDRIPYTDEMLATIFRRKVTTVRLALQTFEQFGMIEIINNVITIPNWSKHQTLDQIDKRREYQRLYMAKKREEQKQLICEPNSEPNGETNVSPIEEDIEVDKDKEEDRDIDSTHVADSIDYEGVITYYHSVCVDLPKVRQITKPRQQKIKARIKDFGKEALKTVFDKTAQSDFLSGRSKDWKATFDWLLEPKNFVKVLEGNYDNKKGKTLKDMNLEPNMDLFD